MAEDGAEERIFIADGVRESLGFASKTTFYSRFSNQAGSIPCRDRTADDTSIREGRKVPRV